MCSSSNGRYTAIVAIRRFFLLFFSFPLYLFLYFSTYGRTSWYSDIYGGWEPYRFPGLKSTISERERLQSFIIFTDFVPSVLFEISYYYVLYQYLCTVWIHSEEKNTWNLQHLEAVPWRTDCDFIRNSSNWKPWLIYAHDITWIAGFFFASEREVICDFMRNVRSPIRPTRLDPRHVQPHWNIDTDRVSDGFKACRLRCTSRREILLS